MPTEAPPGSTGSTGPDASPQAPDTRVLVCYFPEIRPLPALSRAGAREVRAIRRSHSTRTADASSPTRPEQTRSIKTNRVAKAQALFHITKGYVLNLKDAEALKTYRMARDEKLLELYPATHWWAGLAAYRQGDYRQSEALFTAAAYDKGVATQSFEPVQPIGLLAVLIENGRNQIGRERIFSTPCNMGCIFMRFFLGRCSRVNWI